MEAISDTPRDGSLKESLLKIYGEDVCVTDRKAIHGGDANEAYRLFLSNGETLFLKANIIERAEFFRAEAEGIAALRSTAAIRVPRILATGKNEDYSFLLMEYIDSSRPVEDFWEKLGTNLGRMHKADTTAFVESGRYGFVRDNYIGAGYQKNTGKDCFIEFFSECRLRPQFELAEKYFDGEMIRKSNRLLDTLDKYLIEPDRPSILHGDLWSGNYMSDEKGLPMLIDPAVYVGCNEADIAMTELFGGFDKRFYDSYFEFMGMISGYADRRDLYNLYHLLNHLNLFGSSYLYAVIRIIDRYS